MSKVEVNQISSQCGSTLTIGQSGDTVQLASGATQTGFGRTGTVDWDTTVKTAAFTAENGKGYFVNTTSAAITVTLPASPSAGNIVAVMDYANTASTNNITVARNGSKIDGESIDAIMKIDGQSNTLVYVDSTEGWKTVNNASAQINTSLFVTATGGTVVTCGNFKTHIFTGPGTFCVSCAGNSAGSSTVDYFVVAGGGGGGNDAFSSPRIGGGAGAGGFRVSNSVGCIPAPSMSPLANPTGLPVSVQGYPVTVGGGSPAGGPASGCNSGGRGSNSIFSTITSTGGGGGAGHPPAGGGPTGNTPGGSGGALQDSVPNPAGTGEGNTPPVSPPQGNPAGSGGNAPQYSGGGGGGAGAAGSNQSGGTAGSGGVGGFIAPDFIGPTAPSYGTTGPATGRYFAGGGGSSGPSNGSGGSGGGGGGGGTPGTTNTGGGGGGIRGSNAGAGGSGIVMIRYKFQ